jgi:hypothetical protein
VIVEPFTTVTHHASRTTHHVSLPVLDKARPWHAPASVSKLNVAEPLRSFGSWWRTRRGRFVFLARVAREVRGAGPSRSSPIQRAPRRELEEALAIGDRFQIPVRWCARTTATVRLPGESDGPLLFLQARVVHRTGAAGEGGRVSR